MSSVGFLLGAGASCPFGIPMMRDLYTEFVKFVKDKRPHCYDLLHKVEEDAQGFVDLEYLISELDKVRSIRDGLKTLRRNNNEELAWELDVADELRGYLEAYLIEVCERFDTSKVRSMLTIFVQFCHANNAYIFSTNYDRLIETAADELRLPYWDGFEQQSGHPESAWVGDISTSEGIKLVKLHGSVNWYKEEGSGTIFRLERGYSLPSHKYRLTHGKKALRPLMIIPTLEKAVLQNPYATLLTTFSDALTSIDLLIVIGNSMRDEHIRNTIEARLSGMDVVLVNPQGDIQKSLFGDVDNLHSIPIGMEEFIRIGIPKWQEMRIEGSLTDVGQGRREKVKEFVDEVLSAVNSNDGMNTDERLMVERLQRGSPEQKIEVMKSIGRTAHQEVLVLLRRTAQDSPNETEQIVAIDALGELGDAESVQLLLEVAEGSGPLAVKAEAILVLKHILQSNGMDDSTYVQRFSSGTLLEKALISATLNVPS